MSTERLEAKIDGQAESIGELKDVVIDLNKTMVTFVGFQARAEERQIADREWQRRVETHQDKQDDKIDKAQNTADDAKSQSLSNGKWINVGVAILTGIAIFIGNELAKVIMEKLGS